MDGIGDDHASPGSSYTVGKEVVKAVYGARAPSFVGYSFVGAGGQVKMSSSRGGVPTAADALQILEAPVLRWLYVRRQPKQAFNVDFGPEVVRLYDEWDSLARKATDPAKRDAQVLAYERASATAAVSHSGSTASPTREPPLSDTATRRLSSPASLTGSVNCSPQLAASPLSRPAAVDALAPLSSSPTEATGRWRRSHVVDLSPRAWRTRTSS